jgi:hypothetical protein
MMPSARRENNTLKRIRRMIFWAIILPALCSCSNSSLKTDHPGPTIDAAVSISADKAFFDAAEEVTLHVTITNPNADSIRVLKWFTPVEGVEEPIFSVRARWRQVLFASLSD